MHTLYIFAQPNTTATSKHVHKGEFISPGSAQSLLSAFFFQFSFSLRIFGRLLANTHTHRGNAYIWHSSVVAVVCATRSVRPELLLDVSHVYLLYWYGFTLADKYTIVFSFIFVLFAPNLIFYHWCFYCCSLFYFVITHCAFFLAAFWTIIDDTSAEHFLEFQGRNKKSALVYLCVSGSPKVNFRMKIYLHAWLVLLFSRCCVKSLFTFPWARPVLLYSLFFVAIGKALFDIYLIRLLCCLPFFFPFTRNVSVLFFSISFYLMQKNILFFCFRAFSFSFHFVFVCHFPSHILTHSHICSRIIFINS